MLLVPGSTTVMQSITPETLERLRLTSKISSQDWFDILQIQWKDYQDLKLGKSLLSERSMIRIADYLKIRPEEIIKGNVDYRELALRLDNKSTTTDIYSKAAYGRKRASIAAVNFLEAYVGWRLRLNAIQKLSVSEKFLQDPFAPISMNFMTDLCDYLSQRQFQKADFIAMGDYSYLANKNTLIGKLFSQFATVKEIYEFYINDCMKLFEQNCIYKIISIDDTSMTLEYITNPDVAAESGIRHLGSTHVCQFKAGFIASIPRYLSLPAAKVKETACVHCGDSICRLEFDYSHSIQFRLSQLSLAN